MFYQRFGTVMFLLKLGSSVGLRCLIVFRLEIVCSNSVFVPSPAIFVLSAGALVNLLTISCSIVTFLGASGPSFCVGGEFLQLCLVSSCCSISNGLILFLESFSVAFGLLYFLLSAGPFGFTAMSWPSLLLISLRVNWKNLSSFVFLLG